MTSSIRKQFGRMSANCPSMPLPRFVRRYSYQEVAGKAVWTRRCIMGVITCGVSATLTHHYDKRHLVQCAEGTATQEIQGHNPVFFDLQTEWSAIVAKNEWDLAPLLYLKMKELQREKKLSSAERHELLQEALGEVVRKGTSKFGTLLEQALEHFEIFDKEPYGNQSGFESILRAMGARTNPFHEILGLLEMLTAVYYNSRGKHGQKEVLRATCALIAEHRSAEEYANIRSDLVVMVGEKVGERGVLLMCQDAIAIEQTCGRKELQNALSRCASKDPNNQKRTCYGIVRALMEKKSLLEMQEISWQLLKDSIKTGDLGATHSILDALLHHFLHHTKDEALSAQNLCLTLVRHGDSTPAGKYAIAHLVPILSYQANLPGYCEYVNPASIEKLVRTVWIEGVQPNAEYTLEDFLAGFQKLPPKFSSVYNQKNPDYSPWVETILEHELDMKRTQYLPSFLNSHAQCHFDKLLPRIWEDPKTMEFLLQSPCPQSPNFRYLALRESAKRGQSHWIEIIEKWGVIPYSEEFRVLETAKKHNFPEFVETMQRVQRPSKECWKECIQRSQDLSTVCNQQCAVIFQTTKEGDSCEAFSDSRETQATLHKLQQSGLTPIFLELNSAEALGSSMKTLLAQNNQTPLIIIRGHGTPESIALGYKSLTAQSTAFREVIEKLPPKTTLVLDACSTGKGPHPLAQDISAWNAHITVIAPNDDSRSAATTVTPLNNSFRVAMYRKEDNRGLATTFQAGDKVS